MLARVCRGSKKGNNVIFPSFSFENVTAFAKSLTEFVTKRYPPVIANNPEQRISQNRIVEILEETFGSVHRFRGENRLGILGAAKLASAFKRGLRELGYDEEFVELATEILKKRLAGEKA